MLAVPDENLAIRRFNGAAGVKLQALTHLRRIFLNQPQTRVLPALNGRHLRVIGIDQLVGFHT